MNKPKVLYATYDGLNDVLGRSQILPYLIGLSAEFEITVVSFEKSQILESDRQHLRGLIGGRLNWIPKTYTKNPPILATMVDILVLWRVCKQLVTNQDFQIIHCRSYITSIVGLLIKRKYKLSFIFDMRGFWADERVEGKLWNLKNPIFNLVYKYFKVKEAQFLREADHIVTLTEKSKETIKSWVDKKNNVSITTIPCCVNTELFSPMSVDPQGRETLRASLKINEDDFLLLYLGSLGTWYMLEEMLAFYKVLMRKNENAKFLFVTNELEENVKKAALKLNIDPERILVRAASREDVPIYISLAHLSIFFIEPTFSKQASSPTKLAETMAMGIPSITNSGIGDVDVLFLKNPIGYLIDSMSIQEYNRVLGQWRAFDKDKIRSVAIEHLSLKIGVELYMKLYWTACLKKSI